MQQLDCVSLPSSSLCKVWSSDNTLRMIQPSFTIDNTTLGFDPFIGNLIQLQSSFQSLDCPGFMSLLQSRSLLSSHQSSTIPVLRYPATFSCYAALVSSQSCSSHQNTLQPLCAESCQYFVQTLQTLISSQSLCNLDASSRIVQARAIAVQSFHTTCQSRTANTTAQCISAIELEAQNCGFGNNNAGVAAAQNWCKITKPDDPCCSAHLAVLLASSNTTQSALPTTNSANSSSMSGSSQLAVGLGISIAIVAVLAALFYYLLLPRLQRSKPSIENGLIDSTDEKRSSNPATINTTLSNSNLATPVYSSSKTLITEPNTSAPIDEKPNCIPQYKSQEHSPHLDDDDAYTLRNHRMSFSELNLERAFSSFSMSDLEQTHESRISINDSVSPPTLPHPKRSSGFQPFGSWSRALTEGIPTTDSKRDSTLTTSSLRTDSRLASHSCIPLQFERNASHLADLMTSGREGTFYATHVTQSYHAEQEDELDMEQGDLVHVVRVFEDGWGKGRNATTGKTGIFPVVCLAVQ
ncbi:fus1 actin binding activity protein [Batrachochytrium dendrobatidis]|nr:fus1 [Batrachochytrium dendrobatidis]KAK5669927.1 fus1 actin binding activity protein [Batrachochytrium dendrobatidis]